MPGNTVITSFELQKLGISPQLARKYVQNGWLDRLGSGAYSRSGNAPDWLGAVYAMQSQLKLTVHVGGVSALELQSLAHFVPLGAGRRVALISDRKEQLPNWFRDHSWSVDINHRCIKLFEQLPVGSTSSFDRGDHSVVISSPERAILEEMHMSGSNTSIEHAIMLMEGLSTLRPGLVQKLLENCTSVKAKRLFLYAAERARHTWMEKLAPDRLDLGTGKRQLFKGGHLDQKYLITVPAAEELPDV
jgi:hypothetical protein